MSEKYFVYCGEFGFETHATKEAAIKDAEERLQDYRDHAADGWDECAGTICWGEIKQQAEEYDTGDKIEFEGELVDCVNYELREI